MTTRKAGKPGLFKPGLDKNRWMNGAKSKEAVELTRLMRNAMTDAGLKEKRFEKLANLIWERALRGVHFYVQMAMEYTLGKPTQPIDIPELPTFIVRLFNGNGNGNGTNKTA